MAQKIKVDFTGVTDGGGGGQYDVSAGKHTARVTAIEPQPPGKSGHPWLIWRLEVVGGADDGKKTKHNTSLAPNALFNLRNTMMACGVDVPKSVVSFDPDKFVGKTLGIEVVINDRGYSEVKDVFRPGEDDDDDGIEF